MKLAESLSAVVLLAACTTARGAEEPNVVVILAADLGCQGCQDIPTAHIDSLAAGVRFTLIKEQPRPFGSSGVHEGQGAHGVGAADPRQPRSVF